MVVLPQFPVLSAPSADVVDKERSCGGCKPANGSQTS